MTISRAMEEVFYALGITEDDVLDSTEADWDKEINMSFAVWTRDWILFSSCKNEPDAYMWYMTAIRKQPAHDGNDFMDVLSFGRAKPSGNSGQLG